MDTTTTTTNHRVDSLPATPATTIWVIDSARSQTEVVIGTASLDLTVRGTMRPVTFDAHYTPPRPSARTRRITIADTTVVNRRDFGMTWGNAMTLPADEAHLTVTIEATPAPAQGLSST